MPRQQPNVSDGGEQVNPDVIKYRRYWPMLEHRSSQSVNVKLNEMQRTVFEKIVSDYDVTFSDLVRVAVQFFLDEFPMEALNRNE